ncbi:MAG: DUF898 family protein [Deltaproteobacteria bacterium]|nr:DUF898 family protein [Deltaproteobacteria bacterium]MBK8717579.1 DUF898 family protein [Deltaproteobacteria bacterium]MBP7285812.1 DUF898 family protein [Nannocystaceae bacterium]
MSSYFVLKIQYVNRPPETRNIAAPMTSIGRESGDIVLNDPQTSGRHAEILFQNGQVRVRDVGSTNGTWFNGQRLNEFVLEPGQWFQAGQTTLQLMAVHGEQPAAPARTMMAMGAPPPAAGPGAPPPAWGPPGSPPAPRPPGPPPGAPPPQFGAPPPAAQGGAPGWGPPPGPPPGPAAPRPPGPPMGPPPGMPPQQPGGFGPPPGPPMGGPPMGPPPMGPPPGMPPGPQPGGFGPPPGPPMGGPPMGMPPGQPGGFGPPPGPPMGPPPGMPMGGPPMGPPPGMPMGGPPMGPPPGMPMGGPPMGPPPGMPMGGPPPGMPMGGPPMGPPPGMPMGGPPMGPPPGMPMGGPPPGPPGMMARPGGGPPAPMGPQFGAPAPGGFGPPAPMMGGGGGGVRPNFQGTGGELFVTFLVGYLLTLVTVGFYMPWFYCKITNFVLSNTTLGPTRRGDLRLEFTGKGGELFVTFLVGYLLTAITFGIYAPWFICKMIKFFADNTTATAQDGTRYRLNFEGTGGELFVTFLVGMLLTVITLYIYMPWFICKLRKVIFSRTAILENEQPVGNFDFEGTGGQLFVTVLVGMLLCMVTVYIYFPWFQVKMLKFWAENTRVYFQGRAFAGSFTGTGGEFFVTFLVGYLLTMVTVGIYTPWFMIKMWKFDYNNHEFNEIAGGAPAGAFQPGVPARR